MPDLQGTPTHESPSSKDARAQAATKARHKENRPWFIRMRFILSLTVIILVAIIWGANRRGDLGASHSAKSRSQVTVTKALPVKAATARIGTKVRELIR